MQSKAYIKLSMTLIKMYAQNWLEKSKIGKGTIKASSLGFQFNYCILECNLLICFQVDINLKLSRWL